MATTATTTPNPDVTYTLTVTLTVHPGSNEHLQSPKAIRDEAESWIASLDATVHSVSVRRAEPPNGA